MIFHFLFKIGGSRKRKKVSGCRQGREEEEEKLVKKGSREREGKEARKGGEGVKESIVKRKKGRVKNRRSGRRGR